MKTTKKKKMKRVLCLYAVVLGLYLLCCAGRCAANMWQRHTGALETRVLSLPDFTPENIRYDSYEEGGGVFVSTNTDPQLILLFPQGQRVGRLLFDAASNKGGGEMVLYYTTAPDADFSETKKLWAQQDEQGVWYFDLYGRTVYALRLDPDTVGGVRWQVNEIVLNAPVPWADYFVPSARQTAFLLAFPLLGTSAVVVLRRGAIPVVRRLREQ